MATDGDRPMRNHLDRLGKPSTVHIATKAASRPEAMTEKRIGAGKKNLAKGRAKMRKNREERKKKGLPQPKKKDRQRKKKDDQVGMPNRGGARKEYDKPTKEWLAEFRQAKGPSLERILERTMEWALDEHFRWVDEQFVCPRTGRTLYKRVKKRIPIPLTTQVACSERLLDRVFGRPAQQVDVSSDQGATALAAMVSAMANKEAARVDGGGAKRVANLAEEIAGGDALGGGERASSGAPARLLGDGAPVDLPDDGGEGPDEAG